jgi:hypothetical protein
MLSIKTEAIVSMFRQLARSRAGIAHLVPANRRRRLELTRVMELRQTRDDSL